MDNTEYTVLEEKIGYHFQDPALLLQALTHSSYANEMKIHKRPHYERIEFLGDAVLELVSSDYLFRHFPEKPEGELTKLRASLVCEPSLAFCAREFGLQEFIFLGKGEECTGGRERDSIVSDVFESVIGAIYLDGGFDEAKAFIDRFVLDDPMRKIMFSDAKSALQQIIQKQGNRTLAYELIEESGPDHDKTFVVQALIDGEVVGNGSGHTKKAAEQAAAREALVAFS